MRYQPNHKEKTHERIVATASRLFRKDGIVATGVVGVMKSAGLTQGAFYSHFDSKEALIREASIAALEQTCEGLRQLAERAGHGPAGLKAIIDGYLSEIHMTRVDDGCAIAAVGSELGREPVETREVAVAATDQIIALIEGYLSEEANNRHGVAKALFALMSGGLQLARLTPDLKQAEGILASCRTSAYVLGGLTSRFD